MANITGTNIEATLYGNASWWNIGENDYSSTSVLYLVRDLYGDDVWTCDPSKGFSAFQNRLENIAISLTNAQVIPTPNLFLISS